MGDEGKSTMTHRHFPFVARRRCALLVALLVLLVSSSRASAEAVGSLATLEGLVEIGRADVFAAADVGAEVEVGDALRTGRPGRARVVFRDDSVLNVGEQSHVVIDEQVFNPEEGSFNSVLRLLSGKVRTLVSEYYREPTARYEIQSDTSVSGVRGTEFIVSYDAERQVTEVVGVSGEVTVRSVLIPVGEPVVIRRAEITTVARGQYPSPARRLEDEEFRQYLEGLQFIGDGLAENTFADHPLASGTLVPPPDRAGPVTAAAPPASSGGPISILAGPGGTVPGEDQGAPDVGSLLGEPPVAVVPPTSGDVGIPF
jgi:hypothetical protein